MPRFTRSFWRYAILSCGAGIVATLVYSRSEVYIFQIFGRTHELGIFALAFGIASHKTGSWVQL